MRRLLVWLWALLLCPVWMVPAHADTGGQDFVLRVTEENDFFHFPTTDKHYTQGAFVTLLWPDEQSPWLMRPMAWLPGFGMQDTIQKYGLEIGQEMYTPTNLRSNGLIRTDRPYAGWLFAGLIREDRGKIATADIPTFDHLELDLGVVGPDSFAAREQIWFHSLVDSANPQGWRFQLQNEPGFLVLADRKLLLVDIGQNNLVEAQFIPHLGVRLGNIQTSLKVGSEARLGHNIPSEFAKAIPLTWGGYLFGAIDGRLVAYDEFLDGDAFRSSPSVAKEPAVLELRWGLALQIRRVQLSYTYVYMTKEFKEQQGNDAYGSINCTYRF